MRILHSVDLSDGLTDRKAYGSCAVQRVVLVILRDLAEETSVLQHR